jgi:hypothetical protein
MSATDYYKLFSYLKDEKIKAEAFLGLLAGGVGDKIPQESQHIDLKSFKVIMKSGKELVKGLLKHIIGFACNERGTNSLLVIGISKEKAK